VDVGTLIEALVKKSVPRLPIDSLDDTHNPEDRAAVQPIKGPAGKVGLLVRLGVRHGHFGQAARGIDRPQGRVEDIANGLEIGRVSEPVR
jgi:hypothetical protein